MVNEGYCCNGQSLHTSETLRRVRVTCTYILYYNNLKKKNTQKFENYLETQWVYFFVNTNLYTNLNKFCISI